MNARAQAAKNAAILAMAHDVLAEQQSADFAADVTKDALAELATLMEQIPDPEMMVLRGFSHGAMPYLALYLALAKRGWSAQQVWPIAETALRRQIRSYPAFARKSVGKAMIYSWPIKRMYRTHAERSQRERPGGWSWEWVEGDDGGYGVNFTSCPIQEVAKQSGAGEFGRYICLLDKVMSEELGWGLRRTTTIAGGGTRCDFRFRKGAATDISAE